MTSRVRAPDDMEALDFSLRHRISAYDAYFVTLAQKLKLTLLTQDKELLAKFPDLAVSLEAFAGSSRN
jgi:predicted nucleic acid-binding protein